MNPRTLLGFTMQIIFTTIEAEGSLEIMEWLRQSPDLEKLDRDVRKSAPIFTGDIWKKL